MATRTLPVRYPTGELKLDLTSDRSSLKEGQASVIVGRDVLNKGRLARAPGRRPLNIENVPTGYLNADIGGHPLTSAIPSDFHGNHSRVLQIDSGPFVAAESLRMRWKYVEAHRDWNTSGIGYMVLTPEGHELWGEFSESMIGGLVYIREPEPFIRPKTIQWIGKTGTTYFNEIIFPADEFHGMWEWFAGEQDDRLDGFSLSIYYRQFQDKRGIWLSNGQQFWLLQGEKYIRYMDLGADSGTLGVEWRGAQISPSVFMFVSPGQPSRVIRLGDEPMADDGSTFTEVENSEHLAGMLAPDNEFSIERPALHFYARYVDSGGFTPNGDLSSSLTGITLLDPGTANPFRLKMRVVDETTGAASAFVDCYTYFLAGITSFQDHHEESTYRIFEEADRAVCFMAEGLYDTGGITDFANQPLSLERAQRFVPFKTGRATRVEFWRSTNGGVYFYRELVLQLSWPHKHFLFDALTGLPVWDEGEFDKSLSTRLDLNSEYFSGDHAVLGMSDDELQQQPRLTSALKDSGGLPPMCSEVISTQAMTVCGGTEGSPEFVTMQGKRIQFPQLHSNEEIVHSEIREGLDYTESFFWGTFERLPDVRRLSRNGDTLQRLVHAGDIILAVMRNGVHRIERIGDDVVNKQIASTGAGTPWKNTVLSIGDMAVWATTNGLRVYSPTEDDGTGKLSLIQHEEMSAWFTEAQKEGMDIDAGYDGRRGTLHFRRHTTTDTGVRTKRQIDTSPSRQVGRYLDGGAIYNLKTGAWTLMDDDSGFAYVASSYAGSRLLDSPALYSIAENGMVFEENYEGTYHPYDAFRVQGKIAAGEHMSDQKYSIVALDQDTTAKPFASIMGGDVIRFYNPDVPEIDGLARVLESTTGAKKLYFSPDLPMIPPDGTVFVIGAVRFKVRWHPVSGYMPGTVKTLESLEVVARPDTRHTDNTLWTDPPSGKLTVRAYRDIGNKVHAEMAKEISIFDDDDPEFTDADRQSALDAQGNMIELEIESVDARTDFVLSSVTGVFREDGDVVADASATD
jgi:hypothetical protein